LSTFRERHLVAWFAGKSVIWAVCAWLTAYFFGRTQTAQIAIAAVAAVLAVQMPLIVYAMYGFLRVRRRLPSRRRR
jgi:hypothetical protein